MEMAALVGEMELHRRRFIRFGHCAGHEQLDMGSVRSYGHQATPHCFAQARCQALLEVVSLAVAQALSIPEALSSQYHGQGGAAAQWDG